jgi:CII-binding regulator of phage lambda lysogenization HflD
LTPADARSALSYKAQLKEVGLDIGTLHSIVEVAGKFGDSGEVLEALAKYGSMGELDQELETKRKELETLSGNIEIHTQKLHASEQKMQAVQNKTTALEKTLVTYERLKAAGFDEKVLGDFAKVAEKYGKPPQVLMAINRFGDLSKMKTAEIELNSEIERKQESLKNLDKQGMQLKEPLEMCKNLLERKFGLTALQTIDIAAQKYGDLVEIIKAIEKYGAIVEIDQKTIQAKAALAEIKAKIEMMKEAYAQQSARNRTILDQFETLNAKAIEVGRAVGSVEEQLKGDPMARNLLALLRNPTSASYEDSLPNILVVLKCITAWATIHKSKFRYPSLVSSNLEELLKNLGVG